MNTQFRAKKYYKPWSVLPVLKSHVENAIDFGDEQLHFDLSKNIVLRRNAGGTTKIASIKPLKSVSRMTQFCGSIGTEAGVVLTKSKRDAMSSLTGCFNLTVENEVGSLLDEVLLVRHDCATVYHISDVIQMQLEYVYEASAYQVFGEYDSAQKDLAQVIAAIIFFHSEDGYTNSSM